ncbi:ParB N-terminal domain-containing protein [Paraconexibacter algicola]|uniref:Transcriptional regulator n=1 Tax=Paraconexibacter algicola TaxID=2133960 RepID=A0A2T4ULF3_9ACTN|nr:ParB N-terminal domain-containing protein [Paraconexibacter algicola]PTL60061.1 transcriptional regulator [Paraconexibacter algicola]
MTAVRPPNHNEVRALIEERLSAFEQGTGETVSIDWRDDEKRTLSVIKLPVNALYFNPDTHRIRAQRTLDPEKDRQLSEDKYSAEAQAYLRDLLRGDPSDPSKVDPAFEKLKDDLREHGQNDPGIVTRDGVLINGNTRCAALRELGVDHIRVGVLPTDTNLDDINAVELTLQLRKDHRRDYSFMNLLLAIDERVKAGWTTKRIQREFRFTAKTVDRNRWILSQVRELIERSTVTHADGSTTALRLVDFETDQGKLEELHRAYTVLKAASPDQAEQLREQRLLAIAMDHSKTDVRFIEPDFIERHGAELKTLVPSGEVPAPQPAAIPGTSIVPEAPSKEAWDLERLTTEVLRAKAIHRSTATTDHDARERANETITRTRAALKSALDKAGKTALLEKKKRGPLERLSDANDDVLAARDDIVAAKATGNFEPDELDDVLLSLRAGLRKLAEAARTDPASPATGVRWLMRVAALSTEEAD